MAINPSLQAYLLAITALSLLAVLAQPASQYANSLMVLAGLVLYAVLATLGNAGRTHCKLVGIHSVNALTIQAGKRKVRVQVWGIQPPEPQSALFEPARQALENLLQDTEVRFCELPGKKRAGHITRGEALMFFADGHDIATHLLAAGHAIIQPGTDVPGSYRHAQETAADQGLGIHADTTINKQKTN